MRFVDVGAVLPRVVAMVAAAAAQVCEIGWSRPFNY